MKVVLLAIALVWSPLRSSGQEVGANTTVKKPTSLADSIVQADGKPVRIFYVHGIGSDGHDDYDSWRLRKSICDFLKDCLTPAGELDPKVEYADQDDFAMNAPRPTLNYLGQPVWTSSEEWNASAPYVRHWKLKRNSPKEKTKPTIYVDEINWWPLTFALKCRQIVKGDGALLGPSRERIKMCSRRESADVPGRFTWYNWISAEEAKDLLKLPTKGTVVNRNLKNGLLDWGVSDAIMALGPLRPYLLEGIRQLVLKSVHGQTETDGGGASSALVLDEEYVIVSHSLGSYLIFAALDVNPETNKTPTVEKSGNAFRQILSHTSLVYFFANQLRLLELANLDGELGTTLVSHLEAWGDIRCDYQKALAGSAATCARPQIVALNDPGDLLTWTVPELKAVDVRNQSVRNATHWFWFIENPIKAHNNYESNKSAIAQMLKVSKR